MALHNEVFDYWIWHCFADDLCSCLTVSQELQEAEYHGTTSRFKGGLNFPAALTIFSVLDLLAGTYVGHEASTDDIATFIVKYVGPHAPELSDKAVAKKWYEVFRNGLAHQWSPKMGAIAMDFHAPTVLAFSQPLGHSEKIPFLIVPRLFDALRTALPQYEADLDADVTLRQKFESRYNAILEADLLAMRHLRTLCADNPAIPGA